MPEIIGAADFPTDDTGAVLTPVDAPATQIVTVSSSWDYEQSSATPAAGFAYQTPSGKTLTFNKTDKGSVDRTAFFTQLTPTSTITCNGVTWNVLSVQIVGSTCVIGIAPAVTAPPFGITTFTFNEVVAGTGAIFPAFIPIYPPPTAGNPVGVPTFPPPTPPPIGTVPLGPLVGPAVAPASVPPSTAGFPLLRYQPPGSATVPTAASWFPQFTTTGAYAGFPNQPPTGVPIVFANIWTIPTLAGGVWTPHPPASTATTAQIILNGWGLPGPSGLGPGPPSYPNPPGAGLPHVFTESVSGGHSEPAERPVGAVFQFADAGQLHQPVPPPHSRRKRMSAHRAAGGDDRP